MAWKTLWVWRMLTCSRKASTLSSEAREGEPPASFIMVEITIRGSWATSKDALSQVSSAALSHLDIKGLSVYWLKAELAIHRQGENLVLLVFVPVGSSDSKMFPKPLGLCPHVNVLLKFNAIDTMPTFSILAMLQSMAGSGLYSDREGNACWKLLIWC